MDEMNTVAFRAFLLAKGLAQTTAKLYSRDVESFLTWVRSQNTNHAAGGKFSRTKMVAYRDELLQGGCSPGTINRRLAALKRYTNWLASTGVLTKDPGVGVDYVCRQQMRPRALKLGSSQVSELLNACHHQRHPRRSIAAFQIILHTALRVEQIVGLTFSDLHLSPGKSTIILRRGDREQQISLPKVVREALNDYITEERGDDPVDYVFVSQKGGQMAAVSLQQTLGKCLRAAGLDGVSLQDLRSVFARDYLLAHPGDVPGVARLLEIRDWNALKSYLIDEEAQ